MLKMNQKLDVLYGTGMAGSVTFELADDGGLSTDPDPIGKTFTLVDDLGLKAEIEIIRETPEEKEDMSNVIGKLTAKAG